MPIYLRFSEDGARLRAVKARCKNLVLFLHPDFRWFEVNNYINNILEYSRLKGKADIQTLEELEELFIKEKKEVLAERETNKKLAKASRALEDIKKVVQEALEKIKE